MERKGKVFIIIILDKMQKLLFQDILVIKYNQPRYIMRARTHKDLKQGHIMLRISASLQHILIITHVPKDVVRPAIPPPTITIYIFYFCHDILALFLRGRGFGNEFFPPKMGK